LVPCAMELLPPVARQSSSEDFNGEWGPEDLQGRGARSIPHGISKRDFLCRCVPAVASRRDLGGEPSARKDVVKENEKHGKARVRALPRSGAGRGSRKKAPGLVRRSDCSDGVRTRKAARLGRRVSRRARPKKKNYGSPRAKTPTTDDGTGSRGYFI